MRQSNLSCLFPLEILSNFNVFWGPDRGGGKNNQVEWNGKIYNMNFYLRIELFGC